MSHAVNDVAALAIELFRVGDTSIAVTWLGLALLLVWLLLSD